MKNIIEESIGYVEYICHDTFYHYLNIHICILEKIYILKIYKLKILKIFDIRMKININMMKRIEGTTIIIISFNNLFKKYYFTILYLII